MSANTPDFLHMTARDLMTHDVIQLSMNISMRQAAQQLLEARASGAPVVDNEGVCVGVISSSDFVRLSARATESNQLAESPRPLSCQFQSNTIDSTGKERIDCRLPFGACSSQFKHCDDRGVATECSQPHCVFTDWQVVELEEIPADAVRQHMTRDPVTVVADTPIQSLARRMIDAHIHRVIVVDALNRPVGIVSSTDILAAVSYAESSPVRDSDTSEQPVSGLARESKMTCQHNCGCSAMA